ncbi:MULTISPECIES: DNA-binding protein [unclassified Streptomyces]|uniref:DNA-binding protein n=1 Tax=unclassified Streptomyces TaxID=2593676 RepID=UPI003327C399
MDQAAMTRNQELQRQWYGAPLGELCRDLCTLFAVTQSGLAEILGVSPAMLSLVMRAQRARIANPDAAARLSAVLRLAHDVRAGTVPAATARETLATIRTSRTPGQDSLGTASLPPAPPRPAPAPAHGPAQVPDPDAQFALRLRDLLNSRAGAAEILAAAALLEPDHPGLADILRTCGAGRTDEAVNLVRRLGAGHDAGARRTGP